MLVAVIIMIILCLLRLNVVLSIFIGALVGGLLSGMSLDKVIATFGTSIVDGAEVALSYALLGGFAALISYSGITDYIVGKIIQSVKKENSKDSRVKIKLILVASLLVISILSQNIIPVHIAFIPILIPPLISLFNELEMDRRLIATVIGFGLCFRIYYYHTDMVTYSSPSFLIHLKKQILILLLMIFGKQCSFQVWDMYLV